MESKGKVTIIGAGPGSVDLLTVRAYKLLKSAQVVLFDRLISTEILDILPEQSKRVYVGKERHQCSKKRQEKINETMARFANEGYHVIRLKSGDPFIFGRGGEEVQYLQQEGIAVDVVPGLSSSISVPTLAGIPLTHRGLSSSFAVFTAHDAEYGPSTGIDWEVAAKVKTAVFLMGVKKLPAIIEKLKNLGRSGSTPIAILESGSQAQSKETIGTLDSILLESATFKSPAIIVIGEVVSLHKHTSKHQHTSIFKTLSHVAMKF